MVAWPWQIRRTVKQQSRSAESALHESQQGFEYVREEMRKISKRREQNNFAEGLEEIYRRRR